MAGRTTEHGGKAVRHSGLPGERILASIILGIFLLIAAGNLGGKISALNETITKTSFSDTNTYSTPSEFTYTDKMYMTTEEAANYLHMTSTEISALISSGEITEYIRTDSGYVIAKKVLDAWFENEAYQNKLAANEAEE
jgi:excisionase family DNA binding protein